MLGFLFGFNMRLGRLNYFFASIAAGAVMTGICFAVVQRAYQDARAGMPLSVSDLIGWPVLTAAILFAVMTFVLQSMRLRDIGWDPVCVIPGWIAILLVDHLIAIKFPALAIGRAHSTTAISAIVNLVLYLALMFWPGGDFEEEPPTFGSTPGWSNRLPDISPGRGSASTTAAARIARVTGG